MDLEFLRGLARPSPSKVVLLVLDGLGGLPGADGLTELETASTPHFDALARDAECGLHEPVGPGITPGSGPAHLALFGYDPITYRVGRGVLSAMGIGFPLQRGDVAARGNFCTLDDDGLIIDRRAGRIDTAVAARLCEKLSTIEIPGVELFVEPVMQYRMCLVLRGDGLSAEISETDPQAVGVAPQHPWPKEKGAEKAADVVARFSAEARRVLAADAPANMVLLRGFSTRPQWPRFTSVYGVRAAAVAAYPMYRGVAQLVGMDVLSAPKRVGATFSLIAEHWDAYDFFYVHVKAIDSAGEDGDFDRKARLLEEVDEHVPVLLGLEPDVIVVTGDHSTPAVMGSHGWHPVPVLLRAATCRPDAVASFGERACMDGGLGPRLPATALMPLAMAHAGRLEKYGA